MFSPASSPTKRAASIASQAGYSGPLYAEISPKTFPVLVREGTRLSQLRLRRGEAALSAEALRALHASERLVDRAEAVMGDGIAVSIDLSGSGCETATVRASSAIAPSATPP